MMRSKFFVRQFLGNGYRLAALIGLIAILLLMSGPAAPQATAQADAPLLFVENAGHLADPGVRFQANLGRLTLSLTEEALWLTLLDSPPAGLSGEPETPPAASRGVNLKLTFANANPAPRLEPFQPLDTPISYFTGQDPAGWQQNVPVWGGVRYVELYPGADLEISGDQGQLTLRLIVRAEAGASFSPGDVRLDIDGAEGLTLDESGGLRLITALGEVTLPLLQVSAADGSPLDLAAITPAVEGLAVIAPFTNAPPASPAPQMSIAAAGDLIYSTFIGGNFYFDSSQAITVDDGGHAYITGRAYTGFPSTPGVFDPTIEGFFNDAFVAKLTPDGSGLVYATFLGGSAYEWTYAIAIDDSGNATVAGFTGSTDFPTTPGAFDNSLSGEADAFVARLNPDGTALLYATLVGGSDTDHAQGLAVDGSGQAYITGYTRSLDFPATPGALATGYNGGFADGFVASLTADGSSLRYATYLGGSEDESSYGIAVDEAGYAYVTGYTSSGDFPTTPGALDTSMEVADAYVVKLEPDGSGLVYGTFLGGSFAEVGRAIALDSLGSAYITGRTDSRDFPATPDAFDTSYNSAGNDAFVARLSPNGRGLYFATYLGGNNEEEGRDIAIDDNGSVYVAGATYATDFPTTPDAFAAACAGCPRELEAFVAKLNSNGTALLYGSYLGGAGYDQSFGLAQDGAGHVYITGDTRSPDFPTTAGAYDTTLGSYGKGFVSKLFIGAGAEPTPPPLPAHTCGPSVLDTFTVQSEPRGLALDPARQRLYVANFGSDSVSVVDTGNDNVLLSIPGLDSANGLAYDPAHNLIWVSNTNSDQLTPIQANADATDFTVLPALNVGDGPWGVAYDPVHDYVYVANSLDDTVTVVAAGSQSVVATLSGAFHQPFHLAANPVTGKVYVANAGQNSVAVLEGDTVSGVTQLWDSGRAYGIAVDETRNLVYVATVETNRIVALGPVNGQPDQFLGWASFQRGYNPNRRVPLRAIAVNPLLGPVFDGGHLWATTTTADGSEFNQALLIPKGWSSRYHVPFARPAGVNPSEGLVIDRTTNRVYVSGGGATGLITVLGDHTAICGDVAPAAAPEDSDEITIELFTADSLTRSDVNGDGQVDVLDLSLVAAAYGGSDPAADLNHDGTVNIVDLAIVARHYGEKPGF